METVISVRNLLKIYKSGTISIPVIKEVNLNVNKGEVILLMGPSGSGKTTLLSIMGCVLKPTSGSVQIRNQEVVGLHDKEIARIRLNHFGFVFQSFNLFPALTAGENLELALDLKGVRGQKAKHKGIDLLEQVGLGDKYNTLPADLSGGEKQRVAIARAIVGNPDIILADEPTAALDSYNGRTVIKMLCDLAHQQQRAVVIVTHDNRILEFADRIIHIEDGKISN